MVEPQPMHAVYLALVLVLFVGCNRPQPVTPPSNNSDAGPDAGEAEPTLRTDAGEAEPAPRTDPIRPRTGHFVFSTRDCTESFSLPESLTGPDGLGKFNWTVENLRFSQAWPYPNRFENRWISANDNAVPSARVRPWLAPSAAECFQDGLEGFDLAADVLRHASAFAQREHGLNAMLHTSYVASDYDFSGGNVLARAISGVAQTPNALPGASAVIWDDDIERRVFEIAAQYPPEAQRPLAKLVLTLGEAYVLKSEVALAGVDIAVAQRIFNQFLNESYASRDNAFVSPRGGTIIGDMIAHAGNVDLTAFVVAAQAVARAADEVRIALASIGPLEAEPLEVFTPHGGIFIAPGATDDEWGVEMLDFAALVVDVAGDDLYRGRFASTSHFWMGASVVVDVSGNDRYTPETPNIEADATTANQAFRTAQGFTQGAGLFGVGILIDGAGDDTYRATVYSQGVGAFGVGVLADYDGTDSYRVGTMGQGAGYFGVGVLSDRRGDDSYRAYTLAQGAGKPAGLGLLLDGEGADEYLGYNAEAGPKLPASGVKNYYGFDLSWPYNDGTRAHYMSLVQGVGWGYRGDWFQPVLNWMGGFGALIDLGAGNDSYTADTFGTGQGFVYGFGLLHDGGGDDTYRTFWWGPAAAAHMGVGVFIDENGNDDLYVTHASGGFGYDWSVAWAIDRGGDDSYGGQFHYGEAYTWGYTFFVNEGGDDTYNLGGARAQPIFGGVRTGYRGINSLGAFLDLGGGNDTYVDPPPGVGNSSKWYPEPIEPLSGQALDPARHKGIGIDE